MANLAKLYEFVQFAKRELKCLENPFKNSTVEGKKKKYKRAIYVIRVTNKVDGVYSMNDVSRVLYIYIC